MQHLCGRPMYANPSTSLIGTPTLAQARDMDEWPFSGLSKGLCDVCDPWAHCDGFDCWAHCDEFDTIGIGKWGSCLCVPAKS